jgi:capsular polysaccharide transport system permease protein
MTRLKALTPNRLKLVVIALPVLLALLYYTLVAADRYVSISTVALKQAGNDTPLPGAAMMLAGLNPPAREDSLYLRQYIHSLGLLQKLDAELKLREHYSAEKIDLPARLRADTSREDFLEYYRKRVEVVTDEMSSTLTVRVQGFRPEYAHQLNQRILGESEAFVNELSHSLAREKLQFAETELARTAERLQQAKMAVLAFQTKNKLLDPSVQAKASGALTAEMQGSITKAETELRSLRTFLNEDAFQVKALRSQIEAMRAQMEQERGRATGSGRSSDRLGSLAIEFQGLEMQAKFARDAYKVALAAVENSRIDATRKLKTLVVIEPPTLPETAEYPRRLYSLLTTLVASLLLYGIVRLVLATIREHQD